ncbi:hypothetical protein [Sphingobium sp. Ant17]|uniref:hypothetical protein n=1 Tax=Sphingobium sp. Ant17 TaxID=1461752 RepID=UPI00044580CD|nr:hypothetical protein [Sphingobium sp. Ant17]EXS67923.1 hypothetical protein BF95_04555 [Sphingobium sp. Ant17]
MTCIGTGGLFTKPIAIILGACALFLAAPAIAGDQNFTLFNKTGNDIAEVLCLARPRPRLGATT